MEELQQEMVLLFWLIGINGAPILCTKFAGKRFDFPVDGNQSFMDGRPVLGPSKTFRGIVSALMTSILIGSGSGVVVSAAWMQRCAGDYE